MEIDICGDYWGIVNKAIGDLETELDILKKKKSFEIQKNFLFDFIKMCEDCLVIHTIRIVNEDYSECGEAEMLYVGSGLLLDNISRVLYKRTSKQKYNWNPVTACKVELDDEKIDTILKFINGQFNDYIESLRQTEE